MNILNYFARTIGEGRVMFSRKLVQCTCEQNDVNGNVGTLAHRSVYLWFYSTHFHVFHDAFHTKISIYPLCIKVSIQNEVCSASTSRCSYYRSLSFFFALVYPICHFSLSVYIYLFSYNATDHCSLKQATCNMVLEYGEKCTFVLLFCFFFSL